MKFSETAITFPCGKETLTGIISSPATPGQTAVVIVVGGPQYRIGSHRQFTLLARTLATNNYTVLRFDHRGMGDSSGDQVSFESTSQDIAAAIDILCRQVPSTKNVVLWGLCDAASAALIYLDETHDPRIRGLCLANPWVRSEASLAKTQVKHYYRKRLLEKSFWLKLLKGKLNVINATSEFRHKLHQALVKGNNRNPTARPAFQTRMARAWLDFPGQTLLILSGKDYTAKEFLEYTSGAKDWTPIFENRRLTRVDIEHADHTFSTEEWRTQVENCCINWLSRTAPAIQPPSLDSI